MTNKIFITGLASVEWTLLHNGGLSYCNRQESFDATSHIVDSSLDEIRGLADSSDLANEIATDCIAPAMDLALKGDGDMVEWNIVSVKIVAAVKTYFGVSDLREVTQDILDARQREYNEPDDYAVTIRRVVPATMTITVPARNADEASEAALAIAVGADGEEAADWGALMVSRMARPQEQDFEIVSVD